jgi:hypothetical protein
MKCSDCGKEFSERELFTFFKKDASKSCKLCKSCLNKEGGNLREMDLAKIDNSSFHGIPERLVGIEELISEKAEIDGAVSRNLFNGDFDVAAAVGRSSRLDQVIGIRTALATPRRTDRGGRIV